MSRRIASTSLTTLRGYAPVEVTSDQEAHALSERTFSQLEKFRFDAANDPRMTSSGPRHNGWSVRLVSSSGHSITLRDESRISILFPYRGIIEVQHGKQLTRAEPSQALIVGPGVRATELSRNYFGVLVQIPVNEMKRMDEAAEHRATALFDQSALHCLRASDAVMNAHRIVLDVERHTFEPHQADQWVSLLTPLWRSLGRAEESTKRPETLPRSMHRLQRAEELIGNEFNGALTLSSMARTIGSSPRSLQVAFRLHRRSTPAAHVAEQRLRAARERLLRGGLSDTVTDIAMASGYSHLGRFAQRYREIFGESPSQTLKRVARREG